MTQGFSVKATQSGVYMMPVMDGRTIEEQEFEKLDESIKQQFEEKSAAVQEQVFEVLNEIKLIEKESDRKIEEWQSNVALLTINVHISSLKSKYKKYKKITTFLDNIQSDI